MKSFIDAKWSVTASEQSFNNSSIFLNPVGNQIYNNIVLAVLIYFYLYILILKYYVCMYVDY